MRKYRAQIDHGLAATDPFKEWFEGSHVVGLDGLPLPVFHGSPDVRGILAEGFKPKSRGMVFFASDSYEVADSYADERRAFDYQYAEPQTLPLYLAIRNPYVVDAEGKHWRNTQHHVQLARDAGHDGLIIRHSIDFYNNPKSEAGGLTSTVYAWFDRTQAVAGWQGELRSRLAGEVIGGQESALSLRCLLEETPSRASRARMTC